MSRASCRSGVDERHLERVDPVAAPVVEGRAVGRPRPAGRFVGILPGRPDRRRTASRLPFPAASELDRELRSESAVSPANCPLRVASNSSRLASADPPRLGVERYVRPTRSAAGDGRMHLQARPESACSRTAPRDSATSSLIEPTPSAGRQPGRSTSKVAAESDQRRPSTSPARAESRPSGIDADRASLTHEADGNGGLVLRSGMRDASEPTRRPRYRDR